MCLQIRRLGLRRLAALHRFLQPLLCLVRLPLRPPLEVYVVGSVGHGVQQWDMVTEYHVVTGNIAQCASTLSFLVYHHLPCLLHLEPERRLAYVSALRGDPRRKLETLAPP